MATSPQECPRCGLWNPPESVRCDCGYNLAIPTPPGVVAGVDLARRRSEFGYAVLVAVVLKAIFQSIGASPGTLSVASLTSLQVLGLLLSMAMFFWIARTSFRCAAGLGWRGWQCWTTAISCGVLQWVAWVMYFVFRSQIAKRARLLVSVLVLLLSGCATASREGWVKDGAGPDDLARDRYACIQESRVPYGTSYGALSATSTSAGAAWGSRAGVAQGGTSGGVTFLGAARHAQSEANRIFDACMEARGWH